MLQFICNRIKTLLLMLLGIFKRALCCFRRRRRLSGDPVPLTAVGVVPNVTTLENEVQEFQNWNSWPDGPDSVVAEKTQVNPIQQQIEMYRQKVKQTENLEPEEEPDFFQDMTPRITKQPKIVLKTEMESRWSDGVSPRLTLDADSIGFPFPESEEEWQAIARKFKDRWQIINCGGALDGKHIRIRRPPHSSALYYNYKQFYSIVLMALVDADHRFVWLDVGKQGRMSDAGVFEWTELFRRMKEGKLHFPPPESNDMNLNFSFVADEAFALHPNLLKPFPQTQLTPNRRVYNYRVSRPRNAAENAFGLLTSIFRVFHSILSVNVEASKYIVMAACLLHNFLLAEDSRYASTSTFDRPNGKSWEIEEGQWRTEGFATLTGLQTRNKCNVMDEAKSNRDNYCAFFNGAGKVPWQDDMLKKGKV